MNVNNELMNKLIVHIGDIGFFDKPYFTSDEIVIPGYSQEEIYNHIALLIEGEIIDGVFAEHESSPYFGYLIGGLTTESKYLYHQLKKEKREL